MYDSYNREILSIKIDSIKLENVNHYYSISNEIKFDLNDENDKFCCIFNFLCGTVQGVV